MSMLKIAALCGSLRRDSLNRKALHLALQSLPAGTEVDDLDMRDVPFFDGDALASDGLPAAVQRLVRQILAADGVVIATPEYNFSIPGGLKNTIDWLSRAEDQPFKGKPVAILSASPGPLGGARVQYDLRKVMLFVDAMVLTKPEVFIGGAAYKFDAQGQCTDEATRRFAQAQMDAFVNWIGVVGRLG